MFKYKLLALACASVLGLSACAHEAWQLPTSAHPADPGEEPGSVAPITSLERYRASEIEMKPVRDESVAPDDDPEEAEPPTHRHDLHMEEPQ